LYRAEFNLIGSARFSFSKKPEVPSAVVCDLGSAHSGGIRQILFSQNQKGRTEKTRNRGAKPRQFHERGQNSMRQIFHGSGST
jgi:hypothetical protein